MKVLQVPVICILCLWLLTNTREFREFRWLTNKLVDPLIDICFSVEMDRKLFWSPTNCKSPEHKADLLESQSWKEVAGRSRLQRRRGSSLLVIALFRISHLGSVWWLTRSSVAARNDSQIWTLSQIAGLDWIYCLP